MIFEYRCLHCKKITRWKYVRPLIGKRIKVTNSRIQMELKKYNIYRCKECGFEWWASK